MSSKKPSSSQIKKFRSDIAKLKSKGLVSARVDARSQKMTRHMREQVKKYNDVLEGKAKVVHVPKLADAKRFAETYRVKGKSVVVRAKPDEKVVFGKKSGVISATRKTKDGKKITREIYAEGMSKARAPSKSKNVLFTIQLGNANVAFDDWGEMVLFMEPYEEKANPYKDWEKYVEVVRVTDYDGDE